MYQLPDNQLRSAGHPGNQAWLASWFYANAYTLLLFVSVRNENGLSGRHDFASPGQELAIQVICRANITNQPRRSITLLGDCLLK